jgi:hypothetical protein
MTERIIPDVMKPEQAKSETAAENINPMFEEQRATDEECLDCASGRLHEHTKKETARMENVREGICPSCGEQMRLSVANGIPVHVCMEHSVVMPLRDPEPI